MDKTQEVEVHIEWEGPRTWKQALKLNRSKDYGVYQIYGCHPVYGGDVLLYIGKAQDQTFGKRLAQEQERWENESDYERHSVYLGRLSGGKTPPLQEWRALIDKAERLLIVSHSPAGNAQKSIPRNQPDLQNLRVFNWSYYRSLLPEVSGRRWTAIYDRLPCVPFDRRRAR